METNGIVFEFFLIFFGASVLATLALYTRQSLLVAYMLAGAVVGPYGIGLISKTQAVSDISSVGIMFLLFLLGLNLQPKNLMKMLRGATVVTIISSVIFALLSIISARYFDFSWGDSLLIGIAMMFSSTIIGLKLLPTTALHHQRIGEVVVSILLMQDIVAIVVLLILNMITGAETSRSHDYFFAIVRTLVAVPLLVLLAYYVEKYILFHLFRKFNRIREYIFLVAIGWCLGLSEFGSLFGVSHEIGSFIAGVSLASSPISQYIAESLKPLRDFFLVLFFFSVGAGFDYTMLPQVWMPVIVLSLLVLLIRPVIYRLLIRELDDNRKMAWEVGVRLAQASEFSLLVGFLAHEANIISPMAYTIIKSVTILTFIVSSYVIVMYYPSPLAINPELRRD